MTTTTHEFKGYPLCKICGEPIYDKEQQELGICQTCEEKS